MEIYLVGGAVRDKLLNLPVGEQDWVVVGGNAAELESQGYRQVGKSFPVFLHPQTNEEYALARTEKKSGTGYHGFDVYAGTDVTLEDDLERRDLTINAIAEDESGTLIDPYGGQDDLQKRVLRHVSPAFRDDPLRVLRVARFAAQFAELGFQVDAETEDMLKEMAAGGELDALVPERVWKETEKALNTPRPDVFFQHLHDWGALGYIFPEVEQLFGIPQPAQWHPEIDTGVHVLMALKMSAELSDSIDVRFATLVHDLGKGTTPQEQWPGHRGHEQRGLALIDQLSERLSVPNRCRDLGKLVSEFHTHVHRAAELRPDTMLRVLDSLDAFRRPDRFEQFLLGCEADARGRAGLEDNPYTQAIIFRNAFRSAAEVNASQVKDEGLEGPAIGDAINSARLDAVKSALAK